MTYITIKQYTIIAKDLAEAPPMRHAFGVIPGGIREASWVNGSPDPATLASIEPPSRHDSREEMGQDGRSGSRSRRCVDHPRHPRTKAASSFTEATVAA